MPKRAAPTPSYKSRLRWTEREARAALSALAESGLPVRRFAEREGLDWQRFHAWRRKLSREGGPQPAARRPPSFVEVRASSAERVEIVLRSGVVMRVAETIDAPTLRRLVDALDGPC